MVGLCIAIYYRAWPSHKGHTHSIWAALQQDVDGSVNIPIAVMQCDHRLILVLACDVNQLEKVERNEEMRHWPPHTKTQSFKLSTLIPATCVGGIILGNSMVYRLP